MSNGCARAWGCSSAETIHHGGWVATLGIARPKRLLRLSDICFDGSLDPVRLDNGRQHGAKPPIEGQREFDVPIPHLKLRVLTDLRPPPSEERGRGQIVWMGSSNTQNTPIASQPPTELVEAASPPTNAS